MIKDAQYRFDTFTDGKVLHNKKTGLLPAMGWNSWNAFGTGNNQELTKAMADKFVELGLDKLGYQYIVLDDGCYKPQRVNGKLESEEIKFPDGFKSLGDYIHGKGLKFGMYNDIGVKLCSGLEVGTCGHEEEDAKSYIEWGIDFIKVDNCYYLWDNATFSDPANAKYVFAPNIKTVEIFKASDTELSKPMRVYKAKDFKITGERASLVEDYVTGIGTFDGTGPDRTPTGLQSSEVHLYLDLSAGEYLIVIEYATGEEEGVGSFLQVAVEGSDETLYLYDDFVPSTDSKDSFIKSAPIAVSLKSGKNVLRIMNHRRQENTLGSYGILAQKLEEFKKDRPVLLSICEWGKTGPHNWGYKVGISWRILNDITFQVGADGDPGVGAWNSDYTTSIAVQYNKAVIMDEFAGLDRGWNDPDMMVIGMNGLNDIQNKTHMTMWCMMNSPLMLGMDLRRVKKGDSIWNIIANQKVIALNQDSLGIQAKRICCRLDGKAIDNPDKEYVRAIGNRVDILAKPLLDGSFALAFINMDDKNASKPISISKELVLEYIGDKLVDAAAVKVANRFTLTNLWDEAEIIVEDGHFGIGELEPCDSVVFKCKCE